MTVIPGVAVVHPRSAWVEECFPIRGAAAVPGAITQPVAHYSAAVNLPDGDPGESVEQIPPWLRASNRDYWLNRTNTSPTVVCGRSLPGYALGYLFAVDWMGGAWEIRGFDFMPAANAGHNNYTCPLIFITDRDDPASDLAWVTARAIWREFRRRSARSDFKNRPLGHGELRETTGIGTATICPGPAILAQLHAGMGDLDRDSKEDEMRAVIPPRRLLDTRLLGGKVKTGQLVTLDTKETGSSVVVNFTVVDGDAPTPPQFLTAWGAGQQPAVSNLNWDRQGQTIANLAVVPLDAGKIRFTVNAPCHVIVDLQAVNP